MLVGVDVYRINFIKVHYCLKIKLFLKNGYKYLLYKKYQRYETNKIVFIDSMRMFNVQKITYERYVNEWKNINNSRYSSYES